MAPIDASDQAQIIKMMDEEDGVLAVRKRKGGNASVAATMLNANLVGGLGSASVTKKLTTIRPIETTVRQ